MCCCKYWNKIITNNYCRNFNEIQNLEIQWNTKSKLTGLKPLRLKSSDICCSLKNREHYRTIMKWSQVLQFLELETWVSLSRSQVFYLSFLLDFCPKTFVWVSIFSFISRAVYWWRMSVCVSLILIYDIKMANKYKKMYIYIKLWVHLNQTPAVPTCPESRYLPECHLSTGLECVCGTPVVRLHHAAVAELKAVGPIAHLPAGALCHLLECAFKHRRRLVAYSGLWGFYGNQTWVRNTYT